MGTNKPPTPKVPYFSTQVYAAMAVCSATVVYGFFNIGTDPGDLPVANWWWFLIWAGVFIARWVQVLLIRERVKPKWNCPSIREWSDPLQTEDGGVVSFWDWYICSSGLSMKDAKRALTDPARKHQVEHHYSLYLIDYGKAYG